MSAPSSAGFFDPLTGASKNSAPVERERVAAISLDVSGVDGGDVDVALYPRLNPSGAACAATAQRRLGRSSP